MTRERGAAAIEMALITPVLAMLLVGGISAAVLALQRQRAEAVTTEAATYGAETAELAGDDWATRVLGIATSSHTSAAACVARVQPAGATWWRHSVGGGQTTGPGWCWNDGRPADESRVQVQTDETGKLEAVLVGWDVSMTARSVAAVREGTPDATPTPTPTAT